MSTPCMIQSANGALAMDISQGVYAEGTGILGDLPGSGGGASIQPSQSWQLVHDPLGSSHYLIVSDASNLCVGIGANAIPQFIASADAMDDATDRGAVLTLQAQEPVNNDYQLWDFLPPTGGTGNTAFIQNPETGYVIELQSQSTTPGPLVVNPRRISNDPFQLWTAIDQDGNEVPFPFISMAQYPGTLHGFDNYIFVAPNQGDHLIGLTVTFDVIEDIQVESQTIGGQLQNGFSLQINCNTPYVGPVIPGFDPNNQTETYDADTEEYEADTEDYDRQAQWMQFGMFMQNSQLVLFNQIWHRAGPVPTSEFTSQTQTSPPLLQLKNNTIPAGTRIIMNICTDQTDFAIGITGLALDITGLPIGSPIYWPALGRATWHTAIDGGLVHQKAMAPIAAFQVVIASLPGAPAAAQFTSGMGTITITASPGLAPPQETAPNPFGLATAENSNMPYDLVPSVTDVPVRLIAQPFGLPATRTFPHVHPNLGGGLFPDITIYEPGGRIIKIAGDGGIPIVIGSPFEPPARQNDQP
jgi:hypothetical protein